MSSQEQQEEEVEVLQSIYEGDECFQAVNSKTYQYKYGEDGNPRSFVLEIIWGENYPDEVPSVNLDCFYNKHILPDVKEEVSTRVKEEAEQNVGSAMTYTLFEWAREQAEELMANQPLAPPQSESRKEEPAVAGGTDGGRAAPKARREQLTKAQKRKLTNQTNIRGERPRGWDWVDVIRHLSQTGRSAAGQQETT